MYSIYIYVCIYMYNKINDNDNSIIVIRTLGNGTIITCFASSYAHRFFVFSIFFFNFLTISYKNKGTRI